jgi:N-acetylglucosamine-6-sulfatase
MQTLRERGEADSTLVIYMGDNGFAFGEHGLIDKRTAYEESIRVPMLMRCPELFRGGQKTTGMIANLDIMPTCLDAAGVAAPPGLHGASILPLLAGNPSNWRNELLYEYYWERNFPQTPTVHALRTDRYKYIRYHGIWDTDELYDLEKDPLESRNLIFEPEHKERIRQMNTRLFELLEQHRWTLHAAVAGPRLAAESDGTGGARRRRSFRLRWSVSKERSTLGALGGSQWRLADRARLRTIVRFSMGW